MREESGPRALAWGNAYALDMPRLTPRRKALRSTRAVFAAEWALRTESPASVAAVPRMAGLMFFLTSMLLSAAPARLIRAFTSS